MYLVHTSRFFGDVTLSSNEGVQQGDPFGPFLFSMALDKALKLPKCDMVAAYLNDVVLGGIVEAFRVELLRISAAALAIGLVLNESKCEFICLNSSARPKWEETGFNTSFGEPSFCSGRQFF